MITGELKSQVDKIWEAFWTGGISNPLTVIEQFTFLLFLRRADKRQEVLENKANMIGKPVENPLYEPKFKSFRWNQFKGGDPVETFDLFTKPQPDLDNLTVFEHMKQLGSGAGVFAQYMKGATFMIQTPKLLDQVIQMISEITMDDRDTKGDLYEYLLSKIATAGTNGQFRTPRHIIQMMVDMVEPMPDDTICDPSCGSSGFLVGAGEYFHDNHSDLFLDKAFREHFNGTGAVTSLQEQDKSAQENARGMFTGIEFDSTMLRIGAMNLQLHGIENPQLIGKDALSESNAGLRDAFSLILANPPFKGSLDYDGVETSLLKTVKTKKTELLFLALMLRMLKLGGRCAVIVPDGVLFGSSNAHKKLRQSIVEGQKLDAVISMPSGVFKPYAGVSTAVLIFTKTKASGLTSDQAPDTKNVWFYDMQADGFSLDDKRAPIEQNDIPDIVKRFKNLKAEAKRQRTEQSFLVPFEEIKENDWDLSINRYKEIVYEEIQYDPPEKIIADIERLDLERQTAIKALKEMLG